MYPPGPPPAPYTYPPAPAPDPNAASCLAVGLFVRGVVGVGVVTLVGGPLAWFAREYAVATGARPPAFVEPLIAFVQALLIGVPSAAAAAFVTAPRFRAAFRLWTAAAVALALLGLARAMPHDWIQPLALTQAAICLLGALVLRRMAAQTTPAGGGRAGIGLALAVGVLAGLPWLSAGALGSALDTLCTALAGISLGLLAGGLCRVL